MQSKLLQKVANNKKRREDSFIFKLSFLLVDKHKKQAIIIIICGVFFLSRDKSQMSDEKSETKVTARQNNENIKWSTVGTNIDKPGNGTFLEKICAQFWSSHVFLFVIDNERCKLYEAWKCLFCVLFSGAKKNKPGGFSQLRPNIYFFSLGEKMINWQS